MKRLLALALFLGSLTTPALATQACNFGNLLSVNSDQAVKFTIDNRSSSRTLRLYWIDFNGNPTLYAEIAPRAKLEQGTYLGHAWIVESDPGRCDAIFVVGTQMTLQIR